MKVYDLQWFTTFGMSYDEAAEALGLPLGTVKSRLFRARAAMRKLLIESGEL